MRDGKEAWYMSDTKGLMNRKHDCEVLGCDEKATKNMKFRSSYSNNRNILTCDFHNDGYILKCWNFNFSIQKEKPHEV